MIYYYGLMVCVLDNNSSNKYFRCNALYIKWTVSPYMKGYSPKRSIYTEITTYCSMVLPHIINDCNPTIGYVYITLSVLCWKVTITAHFSWKAIVRKSSTVPGSGVCASRYRRAYVKLWKRL